MRASSYALAIVAPALALAVLCAWAVRVAGISDGVDGVLMGAQIAAAVVTALGFGFGVVSSLGDRDS